MSADIKNKGLFARPVADLPDLVLPQPPDASLSAALRNALGGKSAGDHLRTSPHKRGQEIAKQAKADKPGPLQTGAPRKAHIGPRSGHK